MQKVAVIYDSKAGHTKRVALAIVEGVRNVAPVQAKLIRADAAIEHIESLAHYDGMIFGSPTYMGSVSAQFKLFMEASNPIRAQKSWSDKLAGGFTNSCSLSGDKMQSLMQLVVFAAQHRMLWVPLNVSNQSVALDQLSGAGHLRNRVGSSLGVAAQSEKDLSSDTPPIGDLRTAFDYGVYFAQAIQRWHKPAFSYIRRT